MPATAQPGRTDWQARAVGWPARGGQAQPAAQPPCLPSGARNPGAPRREPVVGLRPRPGRGGKATDGPQQQRGHGPNPRARREPYSAACAGPVAIPLAATPATMHGGMPGYSGAVEPRRALRLCIGT